MSMKEQEKKDKEREDIFSDESVMLEVIDRATERQMNVIRRSIAEADKKQEKKMDEVSLELCESALLIVRDYIDQQAKKIRNECENSGQLAAYEVAIKKAKEELHGLKRKIFHFLAQHDDKE